MGKLNLETEREIIEFKEGLMQSLDTYYMYQIEELKTERQKSEDNLKRQLHRMNLVALGLLVVILAMIISATVILCGITVEIGAESSSESFGDISMGDNNRMNKDVAIDGDCISTVNTESQV